MLNTQKSPVNVEYPEKPSKCGIPYNFNDSSNTTSVSPVIWSPILHLYMRSLVQQCIILNAMPFSTPIYIFNYWYILLFFSLSSTYLSFYLPIYLFNYLCMYSQMSSSQRVSERGVSDYVWNAILLSEKKSRLFCNTKQVSPIPFCV